MDRPLHAVLIGLHEDLLLLPNLAVVDVLSRARLQPAGAGPDWLAGWAAFGEQRLPVVCFEQLNGGAAPPPNRRSRLAVIHGLDRGPGETGTARFALLAQGYPHLVTLHRAAVQASPRRPADREEAVLSRAAIANRRPAIPNLDGIAAALAVLDMAARAP
jgi:chemosensory pili system protein ChpC